MHHSLLHLAHHTPDWLLTLSANDITRGPLEWREKLLEDALAYPGSRLDGSPVRQCNGAVHSFIFLDYGTPSKEVETQLMRPRPHEIGKGFRGHRLVGMAYFDPIPFTGEAKLEFRYSAADKGASQAPFGVWAVFESTDPGRNERFSFLFLGVEAIEAMASLFPIRSPRGLVVQEHGMGGNVWTTFGPMLQKLSVGWAELPTILILGEPDYLADWHGRYTEVGNDEAWESDHKNVRRILVSTN